MNQVRLGRVDASAARAVRRRRSSSAGRQQACTPVRGPQREARRPRRPLRRRRPPVGAPVPPVMSLHCRLVAHGEPASAGVPAAGAGAGRPDVLPDRRDRVPVPGHWRPRTGCRWRQRRQVPAGRRQLGGRRGPASYVQPVHHRCPRGRRARRRQGRRRLRPSVGRRRRSPRRRRGRRGCILRCRDSAQRARGGGWSGGDHRGRVRTGVEDARGGAVEASREGCA